MLGSTDILSIWKRFSLGCYSSWGPAEPFLLAIIGGPVPVMPTEIYVRENILAGGGLSRPRKPLFALYCCEVFWIYCSGGEVQVIIAKISECI